MKYILYFLVATLLSSLAIADIDPGFGQPGTTCTDGDRHHPPRAWVCYSYDRFNNGFWGRDWIEQRAARIAFDTCRYYSRVGGCYVAGCRFQ